MGKVSPTHPFAVCGGRKTFSGLKLVCQWPFHELHQSVFGVSAVAVMKWVRALSQRLCPKLESSQERVLVMGVDEFWHYLKKKSRESGSLKPMIVIESGLSIGSAAIVLLRPSNDSTSA